MTASKAAELMRRAGGDLPAPKGGTSTAIVPAGGADEDEEWAEGDGEWDYEEEGGGDLSYDDEVELVDEAGNYLQQLRPQMGGRNRMRNVGLHTIEIYYPQFYFKQIEMEEFDARPDRYGPSVIGKYTKGIGMIEARYCTDDEDPVSFSMTVTHRLMDRMEKEGFNETYRYMPDGNRLPCWNSVGRLDIGSESLIDRSKSMKAYVMDLFERYGSGEGNIEGVDMYNACYGGQAAGLCAQNWVESDRWDGRYAIAIATDISDAPFEVIFSVGAACTAALYYPDAPLPHHSHRASCILHRFDFFKPVGWFHMGPVVDGKYSIDAYMNCVDACYQTLKHKMNGRPLLSITDYNVFHTGGGYHVVKKAFERCIRAEDPKTKAEVREKYVQEKLLPSVNLLKIIGPCHTVSSFLNISSVVMTKWEEALGKILLVFTYGSGCASSMYQLRFDDMAWFDPLAVWKVKQFYRNAIHVSPDLRLHQVYIDTWMKFDYRPHGRISFGFGYDSYELDAYYLLEIDPWGRRFYHRGGMRTGPMNRKIMNSTALNYDKVENRHAREHFGQLPPNGEAWEKQENKEEKAARSLEDTWREIEHEMTFEPEVEIDGAPSVVAEKVSQGRTVVVREIGAPEDDDDEEGAETSYQIVGTWTAMREPQQMSKSASGAFTYEVTLGPNGWEQFYLLRNNSWSKKIYPAMHKSWKDMPCVGPHKGRERQMCWQLSGRPGWDLPGEDEAPVGSRFCITFTPGQVKRLTWEKLEEEPQKMLDDATYQILGSWSCFDPQEMTPDPSRPGVHFAEVQCNRLGLKFHFLRNQDYCQNLAPVVEEGYGTLYSAVAPIGQQNAGRLWQIEAQDGEVYRIELHRSVDDPSDISVRWQKVDSRPSQAVEDRYFLVGSFNRWGYAFEPFELTLTGDALEAEVQVQSLPLKFQIIENIAEDQRLYPDDKDCGSEEHQVCGPEAQARDWCWSLGSSVCSVGDSVTVSLQLQPEKKVTWRKAE